MYASDFQQKLRKCNKALRIFCGNDDTKPAGIFRVVGTEYMEVCGIDKNYIPEWPTVNEKGRILKGGWRRALKVLIGQKLVDLRKAERVFGTQLLGIREPAYSHTYVDPIQREIQAAQERHFQKSGKPALAKDDVMDIARAIEKKHAS